MPRKTVSLETAWNNSLRIVLADPKRLEADIRGARREFPNLALAFSVVLGYLGHVSRRSWIATELRKRGYNVPRPEPPGDPIATLCASLPRREKGFYKNFCNCLAGDKQACIDWILESTDEVEAPVAVAVGGQFREVPDCDSIRARYESALACVCGFDAKATHTQAEMAEFERCRQELESTWQEVLVRGCVEVFAFLQATKGLVAKVG